MTDMCQVMSIASDSDYLAAHFPVKLKYIIVRMHIGEVSVETSCIYLDSFTVIDELLEGSFNNIDKLPGAEVVSL